MRGLYEYASEANGEHDVLLVAQDCTCAEGFPSLIREQEERTRIRASFATHPQSRGALILSFVLRQRLMVAGLRHSTTLALRTLAFIIIAAATTIGRPVGRRCRYRSNAAAAQ